MEKRLSNLQDKKTINDSICQNCINTLETSEKSCMKILSNLNIIKKFKDFQSRSKDSKNKSNFYEYLFLGNQFISKNIQKIQFEELNKEKKLLNTYNTGKYDIFKVYIFESSHEIEKNYKVDFFYNNEQQEDYFEKIVQDIYHNIDMAEFDQLISIESLINLYEKEALKILNLKYHFSKLMKKKIAFITVLKKLNLEKLFPLLIDDFIEEIFLDSPEDEIYINHQTYGRCRTYIRFNFKEIERIKTLIRLYSGKRLDFMNPTIKFVIKNKYFHCRFSIDVEPIQINNFALDIRKLNKNILTIQDLLKNRTLDPLIATFLYFNILRRKNITVTGETDTGKTTLINALDLLTPKEFRKIYIENITESLSQFEYGKHQLKYQVDSLEESISENYSKSNQIKTLLHRTPDIIYLGEILTKNEALAMFHCLAAGLRGFQTIHSRDIDSLMNRFIYHFKINKSCLNDLDLIILMKKEFHIRRVVGLFEVCRSPDTKKSLYNSIFRYNPETKEWLLTKSLYETNVIFDLLRYEALTKEEFHTIIKTYSEIFEFLITTDKLGNNELVEFFHRISYYSLRSINHLKRFWNKWKKNRGLNS
ncbi:MAG: ATPase, T2SS/T4P/T4SS family [Candidatus Hermodarchaeota archaeon]